MKTLVEFINENLSGGTDIYLHFGDEEVKVEDFNKGVPYKHNDKEYTVEREIRDLNGDYHYWMK